MPAARFFNWGPVLVVEQFKHGASANEPVTFLNVPFTPCVYFWLGFQ